MSVARSSEENMRRLPSDALIQMKCVIFAEGTFGLFSSKIAASFLRYCGDRCVAVIDSTKAGQSVQDVLGYGGAIPIVSGVAEALPLGPQVLLVGKALQYVDGRTGGGDDLPAVWRSQFLAAMRAGLHIINTIHFRFDDDRELARCAEESGVTVWETKSAPPVALNKARTLDLDTFIIHTCGSDCNIGKKTTSLEIYREANRRGIKTGFAATGQTGTIISGRGITIDSVPGDFMSGAVERVVLDAAAGNDWVVVEGQASINHIAHAGVALAILHGAMPHVLVFCHRLGLERIKVFETKIPPISRLIRLNEELASIERPSKVAAISLNSAGATDTEFERAASVLREETGLPVVDPCRQGAAALVDALVEHERRYVPKRRSTRA